MAQFIRIKHPTQTRLKVSRDIKMKIKQNALWMALIAISLSSMSTLTLAKNVSDEPSCNTEVQQYRMSLKFQNRSAEVQALQIQAFNVATSRLKQILAEHPNAKNLAIVTDLDETIIDNTDVFVDDLKKCQSYTDWKSWDHWEKSGQPQLIPSSLEFLKFADENGVKIFYISDRSQKYRPSTLKALQHLELPQLNDKQILLYGTTKEQRRQNVAKDYEIVLLLGDTLHDFSDAFSSQQTTQQRIDAVQNHKEKFGEKFIVLPNVSYGPWSK